MPQCPYCRSEMSEGALACAACGRDLFFFRPLLDQVGALEKRVHVIEDALCRLAKALPASVNRSRPYAVRLWRTVAVGMGLALVPMASLTLSLYKAIWLATQSLPDAWRIIQVGPTLALMAVTLVTGVVFATGFGAKWLAAAVTGLGLTLAQILCFLAISGRGGWHSWYSRICLLDVIATIVGFFSGVALRRWYLHQQAAFEEGSAGSAIALLRSATSEKSSGFCDRVGKLGIALSPYLVLLSTLVSAAVSIFVGGAPSHE